MRRAAWLTAFLIFCVRLAHAEQVARGAPSPRTNACEKASRQLFGEPPTPLAGEVKEPKKLHHVNPEYPNLPSGTVASGVWIGEALIGPDGRVRNVSVLRDLRLEPALPQFSNAISDAIRQWRYRPATVAGKAVPVCMTVTVNINWK